jgi:hypothetical protein
MRSKLQAGNDMNVLETGFSKIYRTFLKFLTLYHRGN